MMDKPPPGWRFSSTDNDARETTAFRKALDQMMRDFGATLGTDGIRPLIKSKHLHTTIVIDQQLINGKLHRRAAWMKTQIEFTDWMSDEEFFRISGMKLNEDP